MLWKGGRGRHGQTSVQSLRVSSEAAVDQGVYHVSTARVSRYVGPDVPTEIEVYIACEKKGQKKDKRWARHLSILSL